MGFGDLLASQPGRDAIDSSRGFDRRSGRDAGRDWSSVIAAR